MEGTEKEDGGQYLIFMRRQKRETREEGEEHRGGRTTDMTSSKPKRTKNLKELIDKLMERESRGKSMYLQSSPDLTGDEGHGPREPRVTLDKNLNLKKGAEEVADEWEWRGDPFEGLEDLLPPGLEPPERYVVGEYANSSSDFSSQSDDPPKKSWKVKSRLRYPELNMYSKDYWIVRKKIKALRVGNDLAVTSVLLFLNNMDLTNQEYLYGIVDSGGIETILNILDAKGFNSQFNALRLLNKMADDDIVKGLLVNQGLADFAFKFLSHESSEISLECSRILLKLCQLPCMRAYARKTDGLEILLGFADLDDSYLKTPSKPTTLTPVESRCWDRNVNCLRCLDLLFGSRAVRRELYKLGFVNLLKKVIESKSEEFFSMGVRMLVLASAMKEYIDVFIVEGFMNFTYKNYISKDPALHLDMLRIIHRCLENLSCMKWLLERGLFSNLMEEFFMVSMKELKYTMACIVKFANIEKYRQIIDKNNIIGKLFEFIEHPIPKVRDYAGYLLGQLSKYPKNFADIAGAENLNVMKMLKLVQTNTDFTLVAHLYKVICDLSFDERIYWDLCDLTDPITILWNGVTSDHPRVIENACSALVPYIGPMPDSVEKVMRIRGSIHDLIQLARHPDDGAKAGAVTLLARICQVKEMYASLMEEGFDSLLLDLAKNAKHPRLRYAIGYGLGSCARKKRMSFSLGRRGAVSLLLDWLVNETHGYSLLGVVTGLWKLSFEPINCKTIIQANVVERLLFLSYGKNECLQNSLAGLLSNMRHLARAAECIQNMERPHPPEPGLGKASDPDIFQPFQYPDDPDILPV